MGQWLIADVPFLDVHVQLWMVLVVMVVLLWFFLRVGNPEAITSDPKVVVFGKR